MAERERERMITSEFCGSITKESMRDYYYYYYTTVTINITITKLHLTLLQKTR